MGWSSTAMKSPLHRAPRESSCFPKLPCEQRTVPNPAHSAAGTGRSKHWKRSTTLRRAAPKLLLPQASLRAKDPSHSRPLSSWNGPEQA